MRATLKESTAKYISFESLINVNFRKKKINYQFFNSTKENCKSDRENDMRHSGKQMS